MDDETINNIDIFDDRDLLDRAVETYEEEVPLLAQIGIGFTPQGIAIDAAETAKYGRDAYRDFSKGNLKSGFMNTGIAGLSALGAVPIVGDALKYFGKKPLKNLLEESIKKTPDSLEVPIKNINFSTTSKGSGRGLDAKNMMESAGDEFSYKGVTINKRQPIEVLQNQDGTYEALGGNTTLRILSESDVQNVPVKVFNNVDEFKQYDNFRKQNKKAVRQQQAQELQPEINSPTLEELTRKLGGEKLEKEVARQFNNTANNFVDANDMFRVAKELNGGFQKSMEDVAQGLGFRTVGNPGESLISQGVPVGKIDLDTGFPAGQVKKPNRIEEKAELKYDKDVNQLTDAIRTRILVNSTDDAEKVVQELQKKYRIIDSGNQRNAMGMRDRKLNLLYQDPKTGKTIISEVGITHPEMHKAAEKSHKLYENWRTTMREYKGVTEMPPEVRQGLINQENTMRYYFRQADQKIDPSWIDNLVSKPGKSLTPDWDSSFSFAEKFATGGQVLGNVGNTSPMTPKYSSNSGLESLSALMNNSARSGPSPLRQSLSPSRIKNTESVFESI
tara:strand:- start:1534 stop:3210 length:1677 start_codon:yes stop_codon:yes gene_type:complete